METNAKLQNRDYTMIIDKSGSMGASCPPHNSRWAAAAEAALGVARKISEFDPDGITVYTFSSRFKRFDNVTPAKVEEIFKNEDPNGSTQLGLVLKDAFDSYFKRKTAGKAQPNGESFFIVTDGQPDNAEEVVDSIISATKKIDSATELSLTFIQVGNDPAATAFLKKLDDDLEKQGAKHDIVDTITVEDMGSKSLTEVITEAVLEHKQHAAA